MISEFSSVGKVEFLGCLGTDVPSESRNRKPVRVWDSGAYPSNADDEAAGKKLVNLIVLDNII